MDQEKSMFTCPFGTYAYRRMPFGLCNAPATFQRCMLAIFHDIIKESVKVFMDDFSVFGSSFDHFLNNLDKMLQRCKDAHLVLNWEKSHFMVKEGIVLRHTVSEAGLEVDKAKNQLQQNYTITEKELMAIVFAFDRFWSYRVLSKTVVHTDHSALRHLFKKQDAKPRLIRLILLLQEFNIKIKDSKGTENVSADHLSRIENDETSDDSEVDDNFPGESLMEINTKDEPWFTDFANYLMQPFRWRCFLLDIVPKEMVTYHRCVSKVTYVVRLLMFGFSEMMTLPIALQGSNLSVPVDKTKSARDGLKTAHTDSGANEESKVDDISLKVKLEDLSILKDTRSVFFTPDSPPDEPIIVSDESSLTSVSKEELEQAKAKAEAEVVIGMDKSKITRKQSKASKHGHENQKSSKRSQRSKALANFLLQGPFLQFPKVIYNLKERKERQGPNVQSFQTSTVLTVEK
ncbi:DNA-directed DNA polymerase [Tanacetum coccineum]|uniref:DNA-directed DNA polymerase n=1 Tax=Tanacetum coccineum TaxID=301880 RepID=A0ABQ5FN60_9ASTR